MFSKYKDTVAAAVTLVLGAYFTFSGLRLPKSANTSVGPGTMPTLVGVLMLVFGELLLIPALRGLKAESGQKKSARGGFLPLCLTVALLFLYVALWETVGFIVMTFIYLTLQFIIFCPTAKRSAKTYGLFAAISVVATAIVYFVFSSGFHLTLPVGILG